jgi:hypothetical protein
MGGHRAGSAITRVRLPLIPLCDHSSLVEHFFDTEEVEGSIPSDRTGGPMWTDFIWWLRGVTAQNYRKLCKRCGNTGQMHWSWRGCWRFK